MTDPDRQAADDKYARTVALDKALAFWGEGAAKEPALVLEVAEKFRAFLMGQPPAKVEKEHQPRWVYFKYRRSNYIYYRSDIKIGPQEAGNVQRKGYRDLEWQAASPSSGNPMTRRELRLRASEYEWVPRHQVPAEYLG